MKTNAMAEGVGSLDTECGRVSNDHPMLAGHFPGQPIVPGAWLLAWVVAAAQRRLTTQARAHTTAVRTVAAVRRVKFRRPLGPDQAFECALISSGQAQGSDAVGGATMRFVVTSNAAVIVEGSLQLRPLAAD